MIKFAIVPNEAISDPELTPAEFKVLVALYSFRDSNADTCWPSLDSLAARAGYKESTEVSKITGRLSKKGWVEKKKLGFDKPNSYKLGVPDRLRITSEDAQVGQTAQDGETAQAQVGENAQAQVGQTAQPNIPKNIPKNIPIKDKRKKPDSFKAFFKSYPDGKKGGVDTSAWAKAKALNLEDSDFELMITDIERRRSVCPTWFSTYAPGICKYLGDHIWKTPIKPEAQRNGQHKQNTGAMSAVDKVRAATGLNEHGQYESAQEEFDHGSLVASYD